MTRIVENWARVAGQVEAWDPPTEPRELGTLTVRVETVSDVPCDRGAGYKNLLRGHEGRSLRVLVPAAAASRLSAAIGERIELDVRRGRSPDHVFARPEPFSPKE